MKTKEKWALLVGTPGALMVLLGTLAIHANPKIRIMIMVVGIVSWGLAILILKRNK